MSKLSKKQLAVLKMLENGDWQIMRSRRRGVDYYDYYRPKDKSWGQPLLVSTVSNLESAGCVKVIRYGIYDATYGITEAGRRACLREKGVQEHE